MVPLSITTSKGLRTTTGSYVISINHEAEYVCGDTSSILIQGSRPWTTLLSRCWSDARHDIHLTAKTKMQVVERGGDADFDHVPASARIVTMILPFLVVILITFCLTRRAQAVKSWRDVSAPTWLLLATYVDSLMFIVSTSTLSKSFSLDYSEGLCDAAILLCEFNWYIRLLLC